MDIFKTHLPPYATQLARIPEQIAGDLLKEHILTLVRSRESLINCLARSSSYTNDELLSLGIKLGVIEEILHSLGLLKDEVMSNIGIAEEALEGTEFEIQNI